MHLRRHKNAHDQYIHKKTNKIENKQIVYFSVNFVHNFKKQSFLRFIFLLCLSLSFINISLLFLLSKNYKINFVFIYKVQDFFL